MKDYPNLRHVRLLCTSLQLGSVTRAADLIGVSQSAASQALARLEAIFGAPLVDRTYSNPVVTDEGRIVHVRAQRAIELIRMGCARLRHPIGGRAGAGVEARLTPPRAI